MNVLSNNEIELRHFEALASESPHAVVVTDGDDIVRLWSTKAVEHFGYSAPRAVGRRLAELLDGTRRPYSPESPAQMVRGRGHTAQVCDRRAVPPVIEVALLRTPIPAAPGLAGGTLCLAYKLPPRASNLLEGSALLRELAAEINESRQHERLAIAGSLHDDVSQLLMVIRLQMASLASDARGNGDAVSLAMPLEQLDAAIRVVRKLSLNLLESGFDIWDLFLRAFELCDDLQQRAGVVALCSIDRSLELVHRLEPSVASVAHSVLREALRNCERHSHADQVKVSIGLDDDRLLVTIADNGRGLPPGAEGLGMRVLRDRVERAGGTVVWATNGGTGTVVTARFPLRPTSAVAP